MRIAGFICLVFLLFFGAGVSRAVEEHKGFVKGEPLEFDSRYLDEELIVQPGVFHPKEAEAEVLPFMKENGDRFEGKRVLEIGTGSGIISLYACQLGASKVVATDISEKAVETARLNAGLQGCKVLDARLVTPDDMRAYAVIGADEAFDIIISNPPFSLDLDAATNTPSTDTGDLGFSIIKGFADHLAPGGIAMLYYNSNFYQGAMVKYAESLGYDVACHVAGRLTRWEAATLFNAYLIRLLEYQGMDPKAFSFDSNEDFVELKNRNKGRAEPLLPGNSSKLYSGFIVIRQK